MKHFFTLVCILAAGTLASGGEISPSEKMREQKILQKELVRIGQEAQADYLRQKDLTQIGKTMKRADISALKSIISLKRFNDCDDDNGGGHGNGGGGHNNGQSSCWDMCSSEGWSTSYCADKCGTDTSAGSKSCWDECSGEGWSTSYCSDKCGTSTNGGSSACWTACSTEGWSTSYCTDKCGT